MSRYHITGCHSATKTMDLLLQESLSIPGPHRHRSFTMRLNKSRLSRLMQETSSGTSPRQSKRSRLNPSLQINICERSSGETTLRYSKQVCKSPSKYWKTSNSDSQRMPSSTLTRKLGSNAMKGVVVGWGCARTYLPQLWREGRLPKQRGHHGALSFPSSHTRFLTLHDGYRDPLSNVAALARNVAALARSQRVGSGTRPCISPPARD